MFVAIAQGIVDTRIESIPLIFEKWMSFTGRWHADEMRNMSHEIEQEKFMEKSAFNAMVWCEGRFRRTVVFRGYLMLYREFRSIRNLQNNQYDKLRTSIWCFVGKCYYFVFWMDFTPMFISNWHFPLYVLDYNYPCTISAWALKGLLTALNPFYVMIWSEMEWKWA